MAARHITILYRQQQGRCHYCKERCNRIMNHPKSATKEHIVPKSLGGSDTLDNYVMACLECNNRRGVVLLFCHCTRCRTLIKDAMDRTNLIDDMFWALVEHNKPQVYSVRDGWKVRAGYSRRLFKTWEEAIDFALAYSANRQREI